MRLNQQSQARNKPTKARARQLARPKPSPVPRSPEEKRETRERPGDSSDNAPSFIPVSRLSRGIHSPFKEKALKIHIPFLLIIPTFLLLFLPSCMSVNITAREGSTVTVHQEKAVSVPVDATLTVPASTVESIIP
jgi:hypothetical protein